MDQGGGELRGQVGSPVRIPAQVDEMVGRAPCVGLGLGMCSQRWSQACAPPAGVGCPWQIKGGGSDHSCACDGKRAGPDGRAGAPSVVGPRVAEVDTDRAGVGTPALVSLRLSRGRRPGGGSERGTRSREPPREPVGPVSPAWRCEPPPGADTGQAMAEREGMRCGWARRDRSGKAGCP